jgi:hypothetical protein
MQAKKAKAAFIDPMLLLRTEKLPEGPEWLHELLCGRPHNNSSVALHVMWRSAHEGHERSIQLSASAT